MTLKIGKKLFYLLFANILVWKLYITIRLNWYVYQASVKNKDNFLVTADRML